MSSRRRARRGTRRLVIAVFAIAIVAASASAALAAPGDLDDDGLLDVAEDANSDADNDPTTNPGPDTDGDLTPDYLDPDDDDDGIPTLLENADPNGDGDPRDALDSDHDGQPDWLDGQSVLPSSGYVVDEQLISGIAGGLTGPVDDNDRFGHDVASLGDMDGDGINDIAVGAYYDDDGGDGHGAVYVLFLNSDGTVKAEQKISDLEGGLSAPLNDLDWFGFSVGTLGDLDGDGVTDLAVSAVYDDDGGTNRGAVYVLFLNADGTVKAEQKISELAGGLGAALDDDDGFGARVAGLGDLDGDGIGDLAVGAYDDDGGANNGAIYVLFLNADGTVKAEQKISELAGGGPTLDVNDYFGTGLAGIGDLDGDGVIDLVAGASSDDDGGTGRGAVYVLFLNTDGTVRSFQKISENEGGLAPLQNDYTSFGTSITSIGDIDGDGVADLVVGGDSDDGGGSARGAVFVLLLERDGTVKRQWVIRDGEGGLVGPLGDNDRFGSSVASLGDLDGDGALNLAVGAWQAEAGGFGRGQVFIVDLGPSTVTVNSTDDASDAVPGDHLCDTGAVNVDGDPECTLRAAIEEANASIPVDMISFAIPDADPGHVYLRDDGLAGSLGAPVATGLAEASIADFDPDYPTTPFSWWAIAVGGPLPTITDSVTIDGTSQPGWRANTTVGGAAVDATLPIVVTGDALSLVEVQGSGTTLRGLNLSGADPSAVVVSLGGSGGHVVEGSWVQMSPVGNDNGPGDDGIVTFAGSDGNLIGGPDPADRVLIGNGASNSGLWIGSHNNRIQNVWVGVSVSGDEGLPSFNDLSVVVIGNDNIIGSPGAGLVVTDSLNAALDLNGDRNVVQASTFGPVADGSLPASARRAPVSIAGFDNLVGGDGPGEGNVIVGQDDDLGALIVSSGTGNSLLGNLIRQVGGLHVDLLPSGVNANDPGDGDSGVNDAINHPVVTATSTSGATTTVTFTLDVPPGSYRVEFFANDVTGRPGTGFGAGDVFVGATTVAHSGGGVDTFQTTLSGLGASWLAATATEDLGDGLYGSTSEFGATICVGDADDDGLCDLWEIGDTDGDGTANALDPDDDGDGIPTLAENADPNGDGDPRDALDSDHDGQPDFLDLPTISTEGTPTSAVKISATTGGLVGGPSADDQFGTSVTAIGDVDGDGIVDLAVGMPNASEGGFERGAVSVLFLNADGTVKASQQISPSSGGGPPLDDGDHFGHSVADVGDLDGNGVGDLAVGAQGDDDGENGAGAVWILFLNSDGTTDRSQKISATAGGLAMVPASGDRFGTSADGIGDLDGDGVNDLIIGADRSDDGSWDWGAAHIVFLNTDGTVKADQKISGISGGLLHPFDPGSDEEFGSSVTGLGDVDGDGVQDVAVGSVRFSGDGSQRGAVHILFLNPDGTVKAEQRISDAAGGLATPLTNSGWFGVSVSGVGDLDLDGVPDLIVGAETFDLGVNAGVAFLLNLNADGTVKAERLIDAASPALAGLLETADFLGSGVTGLGDLDGDGRIDLAIGARLDDDGAADSGAVYVLTLAPGELIVNSTDDRADLSPGNRICDTGAINAIGEPECTLRAAIAEANASGVFPEIRFAIPDADGGHAAGTWTIAPATSLPEVTAPVSVDASTQPGWIADPLVILTGSATAPGTSGLTLRDAGETAVRGFSITGFPDSGIKVLGATSTGITDNVIHQNGGLGIDLGGDGVSPNDAEDTDSGPNDLLNAPLLTGARARGASVTVAFELDVPLNATGYRIDFFTNPSGADPSGYGEGQTPVGTLDVAGPGVAYTFDYVGASNDRISATATAIRDIGFGPTSEFAAVVRANSWPVADTPAADLSSPDTERPTLRFGASDADNDTLVWTATGLPPGITIDPTNGTVEGTFLPVNDDESYDVQITVSDGRGGNAVWTFVWTVVVANDPPSIAPIRPLSVDEHSPLELQLVASDPEDDVLQFRIENGPAGATIDPTSGLLRWTPGELDGPGQHTFAITATDDRIPAASTTITFTVSVAEVNEAPTLVTPPRQTVASGTTLSFQLAANDDDRPTNGLRFQLVTGPPGLTVDPISGVVRWTPPTDTVGVFDATVEVVDDGAPPMTSRANVRIAVVTEAIPETLPFDPGPDAAAEGPVAVDDLFAADFGAEIVVDPLANDQGDALQVVSIDAPPGVASTIDGALVTIRLGPDVAGPTSMSYVVADRSGRTATATITIDVAFPRLRAIDDAARTTRKAPVTIDLAANDLDDGQALTYEIGEPESGRALMIDDGMLEYTPSGEALGVDRFTYRLTDGFGTTSVATVEVEVAAIALADSVTEALDIDLPPRSVPVSPVDERPGMVDIMLGAISALTALRISVPMVAGAFLSLVVFFFIVWWWFAPGVVVAVTKIRRSEQLDVTGSQPAAPIFRLRSDADLLWAPRDGGPLRRLVRRLRPNTGQTTIVTPAGEPGTARSDRLVQMTDAYRPAPD